jgi:hypothetical protein
MGRKQQYVWTRLRLTDVQALINSHVQIAAVVSALRKTNWAGAETAIAALMPVDQWIADLYNRAEPFWIKYLQRGSPLQRDGENAQLDDGALIIPTPGTESKEQN